MNERVEPVLRAAAALAIRAGNDEEHARAIAALDAWLGRDSVHPSSPVSASVPTDRRTYERDKKRRQRKLSRDNVPASVPGHVPASVPGHVPGDNGDMSRDEGGWGGVSDLGISRDSSGSESPIQVQKSLKERDSEGKIQSNVPGDTRDVPAPRRSRKQSERSCPAPPVGDVVDEAMQAKAIEQRWPDPFVAYEALRDNYAAKGKHAAGLIGWRAALSGWLRRNLDRQPPWDSGPAYWAARKRLGLPSVTNHTPPVEPAAPLTEAQQQELGLALEKFNRHLGADE